MAPRAKRKAEGEAAAPKPSPKRKKKSKEDEPEESSTPFDVTEYVERVDMLSHEVLRIDTQLKHGQVPCLLCSLLLLCPPLHPAHAICLPPPVAFLLCNRHMFGMLCSFLAWWCYLIKGAVCFCLSAFLCAASIANAHLIAYGHRFGCPVSMWFLSLHCRPGHWTSSTCSSCR